MTIPFQKRLQLTLFSLQRAIQVRQHHIHVLYWECTLRCNLNCLHCKLTCTPESTIPDMPLAHFLKVLDELATKTNSEEVLIMLTGGEPLLRDDLELCGREFQKRGFGWGIATNGMLLTAQKIEALVNCGLQSIIISVDGLDANHNWLRQNTHSYIKALEAIEMAVKTPNLALEVVTCLNRRNIDELQLVYTILKISGVKRWRLVTTLQKGRALENEELFLNRHELQRLLNVIKKLRILDSMNIAFGCEGFLGNYEGEVRDTFFQCTAGVNIASVLADGAISACPGMRGKFIQGNIYTDSFWDCWQNRYQIMRNRKWTKTGICADCQQYRYCNGNGLHMRHEETGELQYCHFEQLL